MVYSLVAFNKPGLYNCHHYLLEHFHHPGKKPSACETDLKAKVTELEVKARAPIIVRSGWDRNRVSGSALQ